MYNARTRGKSSFSFARFAHRNRRALHSSLFSPSSKSQCAPIIIIASDYGVGWTLIVRFIIIGMRDRRFNRVFAITNVCAKIIIRRNVPGIYFALFTYPECIVSLIVLQSGDIAITDVSVNKRALFNLLIVSVSNICLPYRMNLPEFNESLWFYRNCKYPLYLDFLNPFSQKRFLSVYKYADIIKLRRNFHRNDHISKERYKKCIKLNYARDIYILHFTN